MISGLAIGASSATAAAAPCELHVWAASNRTGPAIDPKTLDPFERSMASNVLDPAQRLYEIDPAQMVRELALPADTRVIIHFDRLLSGKEGEKATTRLHPSGAACYFDWSIRGDSMFGPPARPNMFFTENHGQSSFYSSFKAYGSAAAPWFQLRGVHRGHLPVLEGPDASKRYAYDTAAATTQFIAHAAEKIRDKLKGRPLVAPAPTSVAVAAPAVAVVPQDPAGLGAALTLCAADTWDDANFAAQGYKRGAHYSLKAKGQRSQQYDGPEGKPGISLHSSFILYVACSAGVDLASAEAYAPARDALIAELGLVPARIKDQRLSPNAAAFIKEYAIDTDRELFAHGDHLIAFQFRQFSGRNRMSAFVIRLEKEA